MKFILFLLLIYTGSRIGTDILWKFIFGDRGDQNGNDDC